MPDKAEAVVVCFLGTECPLARPYAPRLQKLADDLESRGVVVLGIDSNLQDSAAEVESFRRANNIRYQIGTDYDQKLAHAFGAERTPEVFVLDTIHFLTRYTEELKTERDEVRAIRKAFIGVGTGMLMTTMVLVAGFSTVLMSEVRDHRVFCAMGVLTLAAAWSAICSSYRRCWSIFADGRRATRSDGRPPARARFF